MREDVKNKMCLEIIAIKKAKISLKLVAFFILVSVPDRLGLRQDVELFHFIFLPHPLTSVSERVPQYPPELCDADALSSLTTRWCSV